jgi:hypothetical protein
MGSVFFETGEEIERCENVADVAEMVEGRLQVVFIDESTEFREGRIFGAKGAWKMWHDRRGTLDKFVADDPMTMPAGFTTFRHDGHDHERTGRIKRLKRADL